MADQFSDMYGSLTLLMVFLALSVQVTRAQEMVLVAEHQKSHRQLMINSGMILRYKTKTSGSSEYFEKGKVLAFNDSSISLEGKKAKIVTLLYQDLDRLKIPRGKTNHIMGLVLAGLGTLTLIPLMTDKDPLDIISDGLGFIFIGLPCIIIGSTLLSPKEISLKKRWKLKVVSRP